MGSVIPVDSKDKDSRGTGGVEMTDPSIFVESSLTATVHLQSALSRCLRTNLHLPVGGKVKREIGHLPPRLVCGWSCGDVVRVTWMGNLLDIPVD